MLTLQQANEFLQGSPFSDSGLQKALVGDSDSSKNLKKVVLALYQPSNKKHSLKNLLDGLEGEHKDYALSIVANHLIYGENDILFIDTVNNLVKINQS